METERFEPLVTTQPQLITDVAEPIDREEVLRYLGYPRGHQPSESIENLISDWMAEANHRAAPRAVYAVLPVLEKTRRHLRVASLSGETEFRGAIGEFLGVSRLIVAFIATAGPKVEHLASQLMADGEELPAMIVNAVGAERAEAAEAAVMDRIDEQTCGSGLGTTLPYSPGYCGMALTEQSHLFGLFDGETAGVALSPDYLMYPIKSISGLVGLAPREEIKIHGSPCDRCELKSCNMRR